MYKDFNSWNERKKFIQYSHKNKSCQEGQMWWCAFGMNIGFEQEGERTALILKCFSNQTCLVVPLTTSENSHPMRIPLGVINGEKISAIISQMRVVDTKRLINLASYLDKEIFE